MDVFDGKVNLFSAYSKKATSLCTAQSVLHGNKYKTKSLPVVSNLSLNFFTFHGILSSFV